MGNTLATNVVDQAISSNISVLNSVKGECVGNASNVVDYEFVNVGDINFDADIDVKQYASVDINCAMTQSASNDVKNDLENQTTQMAESVTSAFAMSSAEAHNVTEQMLALSSTVQNVYSNTCLSNSTNLYTFKVKDAGNVNVYGTQNIEQIADAEANCVFESSAVTAAANTLKNTLEQAATAETKGIMGPLIIILLIVLAIVVIFVIGGKKLLDSVTSPKFLWTVFGIVVLGFGFYLMVAYFGSFWPFAKSEEEEKEEEEEEDTEPELEEGADE